VRPRVQRELPWLNSPQAERQRRAVPNSFPSIPLPWAAAAVTGFKWVPCIGANESGTAKEVILRLLNEAEVCFWNHRGRKPLLNRE